MAAAVSHDGIESASKMPLWPYVRTVIVVVVLCLAVKLPALHAAHDEADEIIHWTLAKRLAAGKSYSLHESPLLAALSKGMYDKPLFHHPPLFPILLTPFALAKARAAAIAVPWMAHVACIAAAAIIIFCMMRRMGFQAGGNSIFFWLPLVGLAFDPVLSFTADRLWMEAPLTAFCSMSAAFCWLGTCSRRRDLCFAVSGIFLGLATLTKLTGMGIAAVDAALILLQPWTAKERARALICGCVPAALLAAPWFVRFHREYGVFVPSWIKPDAQTIKSYAFMRIMTQRPAWFYIAQLPQFQPVLLLCAYCLARRWRSLRQTEFTVPLLWIALYLGCLTAIGAGGMGFQMRHLAPLFPAVCVLVAPCLMALGREAKIPLILAAVCFAISAATGLFYHFRTDAVEIVSLLHRTGLLRL